MFPLFLLLCLGFTGHAFAHDPGLSTVTVRLHPDHLEAVITFAIKDAGQIQDLDTNNDGTVTTAEFEATQDLLGQRVASEFEVRFDDVLGEPTDVRCQLDPNDNVEVYLDIPGKKFSRLFLRSKVLALLPPGHRQYLLLQTSAGQTVAERLLSAGNDTVTVQVDAQPSAGAVPDSTPPDHAPVSFFGFVKLGIEHIGTGYDHLLFLFALLIVTRSFRSALVVITAFTIAHSLTLAAATFNLVQLPARITEPLIALSIVYVGVENLFRHDDPKGRWVLTFAFGLIHGFGFASVLNDMGVSARTGGVAMPLFAFNLGVELGQISVAVIALPIIWQLQKMEFFRRYGVRVCSVIVALAGAFWFVQRVWF